MDWGLRLPDLRRSNAPLRVDGELVVSGGSTMLCAAAGSTVEEGLGCFASG